MMKGARHSVAVGTVAAVCAAAAMAVTTLTTGALAYASPPSVTGKTYSDATTALSGAGFTPVVASTVGDQKAWPDCLVVNAVQQTVQPPPNSSGSTKNEVLVSLNCYSTEASATSAGYSAASPEGKALAAAAKQKADEEKAAAEKATGASS
jgi:hypothetical protein